MNDLSLWTKRDINGKLSLGRCYATENFIR